MHLSEIWAYMVSSSCMYRSSPPPPSTSWSSFRMISFSNCRRGKKKKAEGDEITEHGGNIREEELCKHIIIFSGFSLRCQRKPNMWLPGVCKCRSAEVFADSSVQIEIRHPQNYSVLPVVTHFCYLVEVSRVCMFTHDHVKENRDGGSSQFLFRDQCHLQDWTHHARNKTDLVAA